MNRLSLTGLVLVVFGVMVVSEAHAGLINYNRRNKTGAATPAARPAATPRPAASPSATESKPAAKLPAWAASAPVVKNAAEKKYDVNRDGKLQSNEVKIYLRDAVQTVQSKGGFAVDSDILKGYDKNKDGIINRYEITDILKDVED